MRPRAGRSSAYAAIPAPSACCAAGNSVPLLPQSTGCGKSAPISHRARAAATVWPRVGGKWAWMCMRDRVDPRLVPGRVWPSVGARSDNAIRGACLVPQRSTLTTGAVARPIRRAPAELWQSATPGPAQVGQPFDHGIVLRVLAHCVSRVCLRSSRAAAWTITRGGDLCAEAHSQWSHLRVLCDAATGQCGAMTAAAAVATSGARRRRGS